MLILQKHIVSLMQRLETVLINGLVVMESGIEVFEVSYRAILDIEILDKKIETCR